MRYELPDCEWAAIKPLLPTRKGVRLLGISLSSMTQAQATGRQLSLVL